jgi:hypothetical protein
MSATTGDKQAEKLPLTTSSIITESKGTFMGLDGMGFLVVIVSFAGSNLVLDMVTENAFPIALGIAFVFYIIMRIYMSGKPDNFLRDALVYSIRPKLFEHRPRDKRPLFKK